ncbi:WecB/TagA/CpsF family glycosyltransferase [Pseudomonas sp. PS1]|uniref:WecB/TagA/CpsF family glycosyltransferase n=1 Tax=Stutzerimonas marianensis TaxID=2929513 RepID=A0A9X2ATL6_9GAMM|nr:WecB/TagA/CpsF family glycosyltransferase [Pseudomonas marianensis]MCJ0975035.1 WecB/TagA/CpsF family glycosyltransferase [Pseudomonas marianensis]
MQKHLGRKEAHADERPSCCSRQRTIRGFDIDFFDGSNAELIDHIIEASSREFSYIVTPNVNHVVRLEEDSELRRAYANASHRICDSQVLRGLMTLLRIPVPDVIPGSSLTGELMDLAEAKRWRVTVIGSDPSQIRTMRRLYPNVTFFHHNPPMGFFDHSQDVQACLDFVIDHPAELVVLAVGCPRQEILGRLIQADGRARGVGLCVGASIDFLSGKVRRAPRWMQRMSLEWLHRMCTEPRRLTKRYAKDAVRLVPILYRQFR